MKKKYTDRIDTEQENKEQSENRKKYSENRTHYQKNYLIAFCSGSDTVARATVNARDSTQALFLAIRALWRKGSRYNLTRVRIAGVYEDKKKRIVIE